MPESDKKPARPRPIDSPATAEHHNTRATPRQATSYMALPGAIPGEDDPLLDFAPYLHARPRKNSITPPKQRKFIAMLATGQSAG